jgi:cofilin
MAATGVTVHGDVITNFEAFKLRRTKEKFIIYKIEGGQIVQDSSSTSENFDDFTAALPASDCRYAVYDMAFETKDGRPNEKIVFISWAPDSAKVRAKMTYAGSKDALGKALVGLSVKVNATDLSELTVSLLQDECRKFT